jgi:hypothetical protein
VSLRFNGAQNFKATAALAVNAARRFFFAEQIVTIFLGTNFCAFFWEQKSRVISGNHFRRRISHPRKSESDSFGAAVSLMTRVMDTRHGESRSFQSETQRTENETVYEAVTKQNGN